jgi:hypothetical protein
MLNKNLFFTAFRVITNNSTIACKEVKNSTLNVPRTTNFLTLREEHRLQVFENRELRRVFRRKRYELRVGQEINLQSEASFLYSLPITGARGGAGFEALRYKTEGRGIDSRCVILIFY